MNAKLINLMTRPFDLMEGCVHFEILFLNAKAPINRLPVRKNCGSSRIRDLNTSKAKLRGAKYQREKTKTGWFS